jgi:hypothetical protein
MNTTEANAAREFYCMVGGKQCYDILLEAVEMLPCFPDEKCSEEEKKECEKMLNGYPYSTEQKLAVEIVKPFWLEWMCAEDRAKHDMEHLSGAEQVMLYVKKFFDTVITA